MSPSLAAAMEINALWRKCLDGSQVHLASCPSDEEVAAIIERHMNPIQEEKPNA